MKFEVSSIAAALDLKPEAVFCIPHDQTNKTLRGRVDFSGGAGESGVRLVMLEKKPVISLQAGKWVPRSVTQLQPRGERLFYWVRSVPVEITQVIFAQSKPIVNSSDRTPRIVDLRAPGIHKLEEDELFATGCSRTVIGSRKVLASPVYPNKFSVGWFEQEMGKGFALEFPGVQIGTVEELYDLEKRAGWWRSKARDIMVREDAWGKSSRSSFEALKEKLRETKFVTPELYEEWERLRHDMVGGLIQKSLGYEIADMDVDVSAKFQYYGKGAGKTPDMVIEIEGEYWILDIKTTVGEPLRVSENLIQYYGELRQGLEEHLNRKVRLGAIVYQVVDGTLHAPAEIRHRVDIKLLESQLNNVKRFQSDLILSSGYTTAVRSKKSAAEELKGKLTQEILTYFFSRIQLKSPDVVALDGKYPEVMPLRDGGNEVSRNKSFEFYKSFNRAKPTSHEDIMKALNKRPAARGATEKEVSKALTDRLKERKAEYSEDSSKFNKIPAILKGSVVEKSFSATLMPGRGGEDLAVFPDGTIILSPGEFERDEDVHRPPIDVGFSEAYVTEFEELVLMAQKEGTKLAEGMQDLVENLSYLQGRRQAYRPQMMKLIKEEDLHFASKRDMKRGGFSVFKQFKGYSLVIRKGSYITKEKQIKMRIRVENPNCLFEHSALKKTPLGEWSKWYTVSVTDIMHFTKSEVVHAGLRELGPNSYWVATAYCYYLFMRPKVAEMLQNCRYAWACSLGDHGDSLGLVKTLIPGFWTSRVEAVLAWKISEWVKAIWRCKKELIADKERQELLQTLEYAHFESPSFVNPSMMVSSEVSISEIYFCNLSPRSFGFTRHKENAMIEKLLECERKWRSSDPNECGQGGHYRDLTAAQVLEKPGMFIFSASEVASATRESSRDSTYLVESQFSFLNKMLLSVNELSTLKASVKERSLKIGENKRRKAAENFFELYSFTGLLGITANLSFLSLKHPEMLPGFFNDLFPKEQIGTREITILHWAARLRVWVMERLAESFCNNEMAEMITEKQKESIQVNTVSAMREERIRSAEEGKVRLSYYQNLDATRWSPGFNVAHFGVMWANYGLTRPLQDFCLHVCSLLQSKEVRMPEEWVKRHSTEVESMREQMVLDGSLALRVEASRNCGYLRTKSGMGQGIAHYTSSLYHCKEAAFEDKHILSRLMALGATGVTIATQLSSDDKTKFFSVLVKSGKMGEEVMSESWRLTSRLSNVFNIFQNTKKSNQGRIIAEFNSLFQVGKKPLIPLIKDVYSLGNLPDLTRPEEAVEEIIGGCRRLIEHGMGMDKVERLASVCRENVKRWYTISDSDEAALASSFDCSIAELPPHVGFVPVGSGALSSVLISKEVRCFSGSDVLRRFYYNLYSASMQEDLEWNTVRGKYTLRLDSRFDDRVKKLRDRLIDGLGLTIDQCKDMSSKSVLSKVTSSRTPVDMIRDMLSFPLQLRATDSFTEAKPVHSLIRALQAGKKVYINKTVFYNGLMDAAKGIATLHLEGKASSSNVQFFRASSRIHREFTQAMGEVIKKGFKVAHGRVKPRVFDTSPGGSGPVVMTSDFLKNVVCDADPKISVAKKVDFLEQTLGTSIITGQISRDPFGFLMENFGTDSPFTAAESFFDFFLSKQAFQRVRLMAQEPPAMTGEENVRIVLSETLRDGFVMRGRLEDDSRMSASSRFILTGAISACSGSIPASASRDTIKIQKWMNLELGVQESYCEPIYLVSDSKKEFLTMDHSAVYLRTIRFTGESETYEHRIFLPSVSHSASRQLLTLVQRDMETHVGVVRGNYDHPEGYRCYTSLPKVTCSEERTRKSITLSIEIGDRIFTMIRVGRKTECSALVEDVKNAETADLVNLLETYWLPEPEFNRLAEGEYEMALGGIENLEGKRGGLAALEAMSFDDEDWDEEYQPDGDDNALQEMRKNLQLIEKEERIVAERVSVRKTLGQVPRIIAGEIVSRIKSRLQISKRNEKRARYTALIIETFPEAFRTCFWVNLEIDDRITREQSYEVGVQKMSEFMLWESTSTPSEVAETFRVVIPEQTVIRTIRETLGDLEEPVVEEDPTVRRWLDGMEADLEEGDIDEEELTLKLRRIRVDPSSMERTMLEEIGAWEEIEVADPAGRAEDPALEEPVTRSLFGWVLNRTRNASTVPSAPGKLRRMWNILVE